MKRVKNILFIIAFLLQTVILLAQEYDYRAWKYTKEGIGISISLNNTNTPINLNYSVFAPDITYSFNRNQLGIGPRMVFVDIVKYDNKLAEDVNNHVFGVGANYKRILTDSVTLFQFFVFYDLEYYYYQYTGQDINGSYAITPHHIFANRFNFTPGLGYHLNIFRHLYMNAMAGVGFGFEKGKDNFMNYNQYQYPPTNSLSVTPVSYDYTSFKLCVEFKFGMGLVF